MAAAEERFDLCDEWGQPLGQTKPRSAVHRDGDWHRSFHCWLLGSFAPEPSILLQQRALDKDTWPGHWDVSVAGHYAAGEGLEGGLRELREEIGLHASVADLLLAGWRREDDHHPNGLIDREVQDVYFLRRAVDILVLRVSRELMALALVPLHQFVGLSDGSLAVVTAVGSRVDERGYVHPTSIEVAAEALIPRGDYYRRVAEVAVSIARGGSPGEGPAWW